MDSVKIYKGGKSLPQTNKNSIYFTSDGKLFSGHSQKYIGENLGIDNTNDAYGCYWKSIDYTNKKITLSSTQPVGSDNKYDSSHGIEINVPSDWAVNDRISIVNDDRYDVCCTIESISGNTITVSSLPFTALDDPIVAGNTLEIDDYMILNVDKNTGPVKLNETAIVGGTGSKALGNASYAMGWECIAYGKSATAFGIGTEAGFAAFATGKLNKSSGLHSFTQGLENEATQSGSSAFGRRNISGARDTFVTGENNITSAPTSAVFGKDNHIESTGIRTVVFGNLNTVTSGQNSLVGGYQNTLTGSNSILFGSNNTSSGTYNIVAGTGNTISTDNNVSPDSMAVFGQGHNIAGKQGIVAGYSNTVTGGKSIFTALGRNITIGANNTHAIGRNLTTKTTEGQVVLGKYNNVDDTGGKILVVGAGTAEKPLNVFTITSGGTGKFSNNCYANNFYEVNSDGTSYTKLSDKYASKVHTHTITASATDGIFNLTGTNGTNKVTYALSPYTSQQSKASFDTSTTDPTRTDRLNYNGHLHATKMYSGGNAVLNTGNLAKSSALTGLGGHANPNIGDANSVTSGYLSAWCGNIGPGGMLRVFDEDAGDYDANPNRVLISTGLDKNGVGAYITGSSVSSTELAQLSGIKSNVQTQLDNKALKTHEHKLTELNLWDCAHYDMRDNNALYVVKIFDYETNITTEKIVSYIPECFYKGSEIPDSIADIGISYFLDGSIMTNTGNQVGSVEQCFYKVNLLGDTASDSDSWHWYIDKVCRLKITYSRDEDDGLCYPYVYWENAVNEGLIDFHIYKYE